MSGLFSGSILPERHVFSLAAKLGSAAVSLKCAALRYPVSQSGVTLVFTHGISGCKEQYHVTITRLLSRRDRATYDIREIWSLDFPNHGEAASLNRRLLDEYKANARQGVEGTFSVMDLSAYLDAFLSSPRFRGHSVVGIAHSGSCTVWVNAVTKFGQACPNALILLEPTLMFPNMSPTDPRSIHGAANVRGALAKRDAWTSRPELKHWIATKGKSIWARWDPRVLDLHMEYAFEEVTSEGGQGSYVTPRLRKDEEAPLYTCLAHTVELSQLAAMCSKLTQNGKRGVHIIWAEYEEFISKTAKREILDAAEHRIATQRTVVGSGHLIPQLKPDELGDAIHEVLALIGGGARSLL